MKTNNSIQESLMEIADRIHPIGNNPDVITGVGPTGATSLTEAIVGLTAAISQIADAIHDAAIINEQI